MDGWAFGWEYLNEYFWDIIPSDTDILITHSPPKHILDESSAGFHAGCKNLTKKIQDLKKLKVHFFGHVHHSSGTEENNGINFINASVYNGELPKYMELK